MAQLEDSRSEALLVDSWLPDLEVGEFATEIRMLYPAMDFCVWMEEWMAGRGVRGGMSCCMRCVRRRRLR